MIFEPYVVSIPILCNANKNHSFPAVYVQGDEKYFNVKFLTIIHIR